MSRRAALPKKNSRPATSGDHERPNPQLSLEFVSSGDHPQPNLPPEEPHLLDMPTPEEPAWMSDAPEPQLERVYIPHSALHTPHSPDPTTRSEARERILSGLNP